MIASLKRLLWYALWPARAYVRYFPVRKGKDFILRNFLYPLLPQDDSLFETVLLGGARAKLRYSESLGRVTIGWGQFEGAEIAFARKVLTPNTVVFDVGANIGLFSLSVANAAPGLTVVAIEPIPASRARLEEHIQMNGMANIRVLGAAAGRSSGEALFVVPPDTAFASRSGQAHPSKEPSSIPVLVTPLDQLWSELGNPKVSMIKIDVEGDEIEVLEGAKRLLQEQQPILQIEANTRGHLEQLRRFLAPLGYRDFQPRGFAAWNYVFKASQDHL